MSGRRRHRSSHLPSTLESQETARSRRHVGQYPQVPRGSLMGPIDEFAGPETNEVDSGSLVVLDEAAITNLTSGTTNSDQTTHAEIAYSSNGAASCYTDVDGSVVPNPSAYQQAYQQAYPIQNTAPIMPTTTYPSYTHNDDNWTDAHPQVQDAHSTYYVAPPSPLLSYDNSYSQEPPACELDRTGGAMNDSTAQDSAYQPNWGCDTPSSTYAEAGSDREPDGRVSPDEPTPRGGGRGGRRRRSGREPRDPERLSEYLYDDEAPFDGAMDRDSRHHRISSILEDPRYYYQR